MTRILTVLAVTGLLAAGAVACGDDEEEDAAAPTTGDAPASVEVSLAQQNDSALSGTAELVELGDDRIRVTISLEGGDDGPARPAHIHRGTCADLDPAPAYGLTNVENGASETVVVASLDELRAGTFAVNLHRSVDDLEAYVACGDLG